MVGAEEPAAGPLLERAAEQAAIDAAIDAALAGSGSVLLVEGAAGIGKTRLLAYACERAAAAGMTVLTARAAEYEDGYAWGVVTQLFDSELRSSSGGTREDAATLAARALIQPERPRDEDAYAVLHGLYWLTADIAQRAPLLLAIDDLQWADPPSQRFLAHLARRLGDLRAALTVTVREPRSATVQDKALTAALAAEPGVLTVRPAALSAAGSARLVAALGGSSPAASAARRTAPTSHWTLAQGRQARTPRRSAARGHRSPPRAAA